MKVDEKIENYLTEIMPRGFGYQMDKKVLRIIKYREVNVECCGTCMYFKGEVCKNPENIATAADVLDTVIPASAGLSTSVNGLCEVYKRRW